MADVTINPQAYCKMMLHVAKYAHRAVNGVLLAEKPKHKDAKGMKVVDSIPLFHLTLSLAPMMEVALLQVDEYCRSVGLVIAGYYQANEHFSDSEPSGIAYKIAEKINENVPGAILLMIDNQKVSLDLREEAYRVYTHTDGKWKVRDHRNTLGKTSLEAASALLRSKAYRELVDFDNHLDDIRLDWKNQEVNEHLKHST